MGCQEQTLKRHFSGGQRPVRVETGDSTGVVALCALAHLDWETAFWMNSD